MENEFVKGNDVGVVDIYKAPKLAFEILKRQRVGGSKHLQGELLPSACLILDIVHLPETAASQSGEHTKTFGDEPANQSSTGGIGGCRTLLAEVLIDERAQ